MTNLNLDGLFNTTVIDCTDTDYNYRHLTGWRWFLYSRFGAFSFARRLIGGRWELWLLSHRWGLMWLPVIDWSTAKNLPPFVHKGRPVKTEQWPKPIVIDHHMGPYR